MNQETRLVNKWVLEKQLQQWLGLAQGREQVSKRALMDALKAYYTLPEISGVYQEMLTHGFSRVDWGEIADQLLRQKSLEKQNP